MSEQERKQWVEFYARQIADLFRKWQDPHQIDNRDHAASQIRELEDSYDDPLRKSLIESMVTR